MPWYVSMDRLGQAHRSCRCNLQLPITTLLVCLVQLPLYASPSPSFASLLWQTKSRLLRTSSFTTRFAWQDPKRALSDPRLRPSRLHVSFMVCRPLGPWHTSDVSRPVRLMTAQWRFKDTIPAPERHAAVWLPLLQLPEVLAQVADTCLATEQIFSSSSAHTLPPPSQH